MSIFSISLVEQERAPSANGEQGIAAAVAVARICHQSEARRGPARGEVPRRAVQSFIFPHGNHGETFTVVHHVKRGRYD